MSDLPRAPYILLYQIQKNNQNDPSKRIVNLVESLPQEWLSSWSFQDVDKVYDQKWFKSLALSSVPCIYVTQTGKKHAGADAFQFLENYKQSKEQELKRTVASKVASSGISAPSAVISMNNYVTIDQFNDLKQKLSDLEKYTAKLDKLCAYIAKKANISTKKVLKPEPEPVKAISVSSSSMQSSTSDDLMTRMFDIVSKKNHVPKKKSHSVSEEKVDRSDKSGSETKKEEDRASQKSESVYGGSEEENSNSEEESGGGFTSQFEN
jgi:hypothetical protein